MDVWAQRAHMPMPMCISVCEVCMFFHFHFVISVVIFLQYLLSFLGVSSSAVLHNSNGFSSIVWCILYFFQTICVMCSIHHSTRCLFVLPQTFTDAHTHTLNFHSFVLCFSHFIFSWACNVVCGMRDNLNTHSVILFSSSYICVDILSALHVFTMLALTHTNVFLSPFRSSSLGTFFSQDYNLLIFAHHLSSHHTITA